MKFLVKLGMLVVGSSLLVACSTVSALIGVDSQEINQQSALAYSQAINEAGKIDTTSQTAKRIHKVFNKMKPIADAENKTGVKFNWELTVIRSDTVNAWAMPGGKMAFYTGIVDQLKLNDAEIAAVMGHEMTHALHEHAKQQMTAQKSIGLASDFACAQADISLCQSKEIMGVLTSYGIDKPFSRHHESEADVNGMMLMAKAGYDPKNAISMVDKLSGGSKSSFITNFLSTHPGGDNRRENLLQHLAQAEQLYKR